MTKILKPICLTAILTLVLSFGLVMAPQAAASSGVVANGGFETGDFIGWSSAVPAGATAQVVTSHFGLEGEIYEPKEGSYFALLTTDGDGVYNILSQTFSVAAGGTISGWAFFETWDYMPFDDNAQVRILQDSTVVAVLFDESVSSVGDCGETPWTFWEYTFRTAGTYTLEARITNEGDAEVVSYLGLDGVVSPLLQQRQLLTNEEATQPMICITRWWAQTFTPAVTADLSEVTLMLRRATYFVDPGTVIVEVTECDAEGKPQRTPGEPDDKSDVLGTATIELPASGEWEICTFENFTDAEGEPVTVSLTKDTKYAIVAYTLGLPREDSCQWMQGPRDSDPYPDGTSFSWDSTKPKIWNPYKISKWYIDFYFDTFALEAARRLRAYVGIALA